MWRLACLATLLLTVSGPASTAPADQSGPSVPKQEVEDGVSVSPVLHEDYEDRGNYRPATAFCYMATDGKQVVKCKAANISRSQADMEWRSARDGDCPDGGVVAGFQDDWPAVVCRGNVTRDGATVTAAGLLTVKPGVRGCKVPSHDQTVVMEYEVLVHSDKRPSFVPGDFIPSSFGAYFDVSKTVNMLYSEERQHVSVCRVRVNDDVTVPGKFLPSIKGCDVVSGSELSLASYEILLKSPGMEWQYVSRGESPENAILAGYENGYPVLVCRAPFTSQSRQIKVPGKVVTRPGRGSGCWFPIYGPHVADYDYEILVSNSN